MYGLNIKGGAKVHRLFSIKNNLFHIQRIFLECVEKIAKNLNSILFALIKLD